MRAGAAGRDCHRRNWERLSQAQRGALFTGRVQRQENLTDQARAQYGETVRSIA